MQLFRKIRITFLRWAKERKSGESDSIKNAFKGVVYGYALYYGSWLVLVLAGLAVLSFTTWLGGPYTAAQVVFFLIAGTVSIIALNIFWLWQTLKGKWDSGRDQNQYRNARDITDKDTGDNIREGHVIESESGRDTM
jgi:hypothetical protein